MPTALPIGSVISFAGEKNNIPKGWLPCEGQLLSNQKYPLLFKSIGTVWGGSGTPNFYIPDLRGLFLRGVSGETMTDPDKDSRHSPQQQSSPTNPGNNGNAVGSMQIDSFKSHDHNFKDPGHGHLYTKGTTVDTWGGNVVSSGQDIGQQAAVKSSPTNITFSKEGANENRPVNAYVYFIIKVED